MKKLALTVAIAVAAVATSAQAYQFELNGGVDYSNNISHIGHDNNEAAGVGGSATVYLKNVDTKTGPLAEAAFINQASSINAGYHYSQTDDNQFQGFDGFNVVLDNDKSHTINAGGEFYIPTSMIGLGETLPVTLYAAGGATRTKYESDPYNGYNYKAEVGIIPNKLPYNLGTLLVTAGVAGRHYTPDSELDPTVRAKLLTKFYQNDINIEAHAQFGGSNRSEYGNKYNIAGVNVDFYADRTFSVGGGYERTFIDGQHDPFVVNANFRKFLMDNLSIQGGINFGKAQFDDNLLGVYGGATLRF